MEDTDFGAPLQEAFESLKDYFDQLLEYNKLVMGKKAGEFFAFTMLFVWLGLLAALILVFLSFAFVWWFSGMGFGETYVGYLIVSLFYFLLGLLIFIYREKLIFNPIRKLLGNILYEDDEEEADEAIHFSTKELLDHKIIKSKKSLQYKEAEMKKHFSGLGETYTFSSISQKLFKTAYQSIMTTSNIARFTYLLVRKLKSGKKKKHKEIT